MLTQQATQRWRFTYVISYDMLTDSCQVFSSFRALHLHLWTPFALYLWTDLTNKLDFLIDLCSVTSFSIAITIASSKLPDLALWLWVSASFQWNFKIALPWPNWRSVCTGQQLSLVASSCPVELLAPQASSNWPLVGDHCVLVSICLTPVPGWRIDFKYSWQVSTFMSATWS